MRIHLSSFLLFIGLCLHQKVLSQTVSSGAGFILPVASRIQSNNIARILTFANQENETVTIGQIQKSVNLSRSYFAAYARYDGRNRFFAGMAFSGFIVRNTLDYKAVAKYKDPNVGFNTITRIDNTPIIQDFSFLNIHLNAGTRLYYNRIIQPYVSGGIVVRKIIYHRFGNGFRTVLGRENRNEMVYQTMNTFTPHNIGLSAQAGIKFYDVRLEVFAESSISKLDQADPVYYSKFWNVGIGLTYDFFIQQLFSQK